MKNNNTRFLLNDYDFQKAFEFICVGHNIIMVNICIRTGYRYKRIISEGNHANSCR